EPRPAGIDGVSPMRAPLLLALAAFAAPALADTLTRVRIDTPEARALGSRLEQAGFDVLEGSLSANSLEVVASTQTLATLQSMGLKYAVVERGHPLQQAGDAVPSG